METIKITTWRFGEITIKPEDSIEFTQPILGFPDSKNFTLLEEEDQAPFIWLQSIDEPDVSFVMLDPTLFFPDYKIAVDPNEIEDLEIETTEDGAVLVILVVPEDPQKITANLRGPVIFNKKKKKAKQIVLQDEKYPLRYPIITDESTSDDKKEKS